MIHHGGTEDTEKTFVFPEQETTLGKEQSLGSTSSSFPVSPGKEEQGFLCDLCVSSEAGGERNLFLHPSMDVLSDIVKEGKSCGG
jgi:hypothetical protein